MELHNNEVPASEVWVVVIENAWGNHRFEWFITPKAATQEYNLVVGEQEHRYWKEEVTVSRWYVELPRQRMDRDDVDIFVEGALEGLIEGYTPRRLDFRSFTPQRKEATQ